MNEEDRALIIVELRLRGAHPTWINHWLAKFSKELMDLYRNGWICHDGSDWTPFEEWTKPRHD